MQGELGWQPVEQKRAVGFIPRRAGEEPSVEAR